MLLVYLKALGVRELGPWVVVAVTTISVETVTKDTVAMTMVTRSKSQLTGYQFCLETASSPSLLPSPLKCSICGAREASGSRDLHLSALFSTDEPCNLN